MKKSELTYPVPSQIEDPEQIIDLLNDAARRSDRFEPGEIEYIETTRESIGPGEIANGILIVSGGAIGWFITKWADEYLWPLLKERINPPSRRAVEWLKSIIPSNTKSSED